MLASSLSCIFSIFPSISSFSQICASAAVELALESCAFSLTKYRHGRPFFCFFGDFICRFLNVFSKLANLVSTVLSRSHNRQRKILRILASVSASDPGVGIALEELSASMLSKSLKPQSFQFMSQVILGQSHLYQLPVYRRIKVILW
ncbi:hypothetical protein ACFX12_041466 [Malus domestica]